jgi:predicted glycosyltransferase
VNDILKSIVQNFHDTTNILVLCRYQDQIRQFKEKYGDKITVLENVVDGLELISVADIFIGGGGTMTAESALLGKPTISISPIKFYVDDYLVKTGLIYKIGNSAQIVKILRRIQSDSSFRVRQKNRAQHILNRMEDPANKLLKIVGKFVSL